MHMENKENAEKPDHSAAEVQVPCKPELRGRLRATSERAKKLGESPQVVDSIEYTCAACQRNFTNLSGFRRHQKFCQGTGPAVSSVGEVTVAKVEAIEAVAEPELQVMGPADPLASDVMDSALREKMKGVMLTKVNELIDETTATGPGKCHCCGEDLETAHLGGEFECVDCAKNFKLKSSLERHRRVIHLEGDTYSCPECEARCPDKGTLARHMYTHTGLKPYSCTRCNKQFSRKYHLERHIIQTGCDGNPRPSHPCQVCGRMFSRKDNLREHLRAHAGQVKRKKKYNCQHCNKEFHGTTLLQIHMRTHTGEKPYQCDFCSKSFPSSGAMKKHRRMHTGERPYECKECLAKFAAKETLNRHVRTHTGVKPHSCQFCGKSFIQASQLRAHIFHHTAHKCPICEKCFAMKSSLKIHLLTHTKEPPRSCDECGRAFIRQDCLLRHMRTKHRDMLEEILAEAEKKKLQQQLLAAAGGGDVGPLPPCRDPVPTATTATTELNSGTLGESALADSVRELLTLLVDEATLKAFGWPGAPVDRLLEAVIRRCGHQPVGAGDDLPYTDRLRENAKLLFTVVIDDSAVKTLLNNQTVDEVILHVLRLAKS
ncbi:hypothetical protein B7P43_G05462 [Cryptotermes secundus]|uniref:Zinc finger protein 865 n=1 Tax=Cryptotermes secundus TaxID=105785 RepID=A0A2J7R1L8_9NEOP|nr:hypothetical protein B7P43_G05462 [Cryptotermes secundus]